MVIDADWPDDAPTTEWPIEKYDITGDEGISYIYPSNSEEYNLRQGRYHISIHDVNRFLSCDINHKICTIVLGLLGEFVGFFFLFSALISARGLLRLSSKPNRGV